jgi:hypothetical protein
VCQNLAWDWLSSFFIHLSSFHHMALGAMLPLRTVSSSINYLMISCLLVQFSLQYFSYSVILITHMLMFLPSPAHWLGKYLLNTNQRRFWYENRLPKVKHYVYAVYRMTMKMQNRIVMNLVGSQYWNWKWSVSDLVIHTLPAIDLIHQCGIVVIIICRASGQSSIWWSSSWVHKETQDRCTCHCESQHYERALFSRFSRPDANVAAHHFTQMGPKVLQTVS